MLQRNKSAFINSTVYTYNIGSNKDDGDKSNILVWCWHVYIHIDKKPYQLISILWIQLIKGFMSVYQQGRAGRDSGGMDLKDLYQYMLPRRSIEPCIDGMQAFFFIVRRSYKKRRQRQFKWYFSQALTCIFILHSYWQKGQRAIAVKPTLYQLR